MFRYTLTTLLNQHNSLYKWSKFYKHYNDCRSTASRCQSGGGSSGSSRRSWPWVNRWSCNKNFIFYSNLRHGLEDSARSSHSSSNSPWLLDNSSSIPRTSGPRASKQTISEVCDSAGGPSCAWDDGCDLHGRWRTTRCGVDWTDLQVAQIRRDMGTDSWIYTGQIAYPSGKFRAGIDDTALDNIPLTGFGDLDAVALVHWSMPEGKYRKIVQIKLISKKYEVEGQIYSFWWVSPIVSL